MQKAIAEGPRGEEWWRELVARQAASGLSLREFCRREGLSAWSLYEWRSRLRSRNEPPAAAAPNKQAPSAFLDLGALESGHGRCEIRLDLGGGVVLEVVRC
ncbi:MAG: transposase [Steroidobacteraceae bacterium]